MNIGIDAGCLGVVDERLKVGVYNVAKNLLIQIGKIDKVHRYYLYSFYPIDAELLEEFGSQMQNIVVKPVRGWMKIWLPLRLQQDPIDIFLAFGQAIPAMKKSIKKIGYVYDIAFEKYPQFYPDSYQQLHSITKNLISKSNHIITLSDAAKKDICQYYTISERQVSSIYLGGRSTIEDQKKDVRGKYFLYVGALKRIKNVSAVIKAFALFYSKKKNYKLLIVGGNRWMDPEITKIYDKLPKDIKDQIDFRGFVDDVELFHLYRYAEALIAPSYYEGFGLPVIEAMQAGCPVIVSNRGSLPEIVRDAGYIVNPEDYKTIAQYLNSLAQSKSLRESLSDKSLKRAKLFSWEKCAKETLYIINNI